VKKRVRNMKKIKIQKSALTFSFIALSLLTTSHPAFAEGAAEYASPWVTDTTDYNTAQVVSHTANFENSQPKMIAPGPSPLFHYCDNKNGGKTHYCFARVKTGPWAADPSIFTDRRAWVGNAKFTYEYAKCVRRGGGAKYIPGSSATSANDDWTSNSGGNIQHAKDNCAGTLNSFNLNAGDAKGFFCPLGSKFRGIGGVYTNPFQACAQYDPYARCPGYWDDGSGGCDPDNFDLCTYKPHGNCSDSQFASYQTQYKNCLEPIKASNVDNQGLGYDDCFCSHETNGIRDYGFLFTNGIWKCLKCADGMKQRDDTGVGCVSRCPANQAWVNNSCQSCPSGQEAFNAKCVAACNADIGQVRNLDTGKCEMACPSGMTATRSGTDSAGKPIYSCGCNNPRFEAGTVRVPSIPRGIANVSSPAWLYEANLTADNIDAGCTCGDAANNSSLFDQSFAIAGDINPATRLPYGMVPMTSPTDATKLVCGCPNYNELYQLDPATGYFSCRPQITGAAATAVVLTAVSNPADRAGSGIVDAKSTFPTQSRALLRGAGDMSDAYTRRVWTCAPGFYLNGNQCDPVESAPDKFACTDDANQITPSSVLNSSIAQALAPGGALAGKTFDKITNRRLACCVQDSGVNPKPVCAESSLRAFIDGGGTFDDYYDVPGGDNAAAKITFPNRVYLTDATGRAVTGLFRASDGTRCNLPAAGGPSAEMSIYSDIARRSRVPATQNNALGSPATVAAFGGAVDPRCNQVIRAALDVTCDANPLDAFGNPTTITIAGVRRCVGAPTSIVVHYDIIDLTNPGQTRRATFRDLSSTRNGTLATPLDMKSLLSR
jgi:hypothetical protein